MPSSRRASSPKRTVSERSAQITRCAHLVASTSKTVCDGQEHRNASKPAERGRRLLSIRYLFIKKVLTRHSAPTIESIARAINPGSLFGAPANVTAHVRCLHRRPDPWPERPVGDPEERRSACRGEKDRSRRLHQRAPGP